MTRKKQVSKPMIEELVSNLGRTTVISVGVSKYKDLQELSGVQYDLEMVEDIFISSDNVATYKPSHYFVLDNPTSNQFRQEIIRFAIDRSARGDILILYFSGHGAVLRGESFAFCLSDTRLGYESNGVLPVSVVPFQDVALSLTLVSSPTRYP